MVLLTFQRLSELSERMFPDWPSCSLSLQYKVNIRAVVSLTQTEHRMSLQNKLIFLQKICNWPKARQNV